jgi:hypothetical protein
MQVLGTILLLAFGGLLSFAMAEGAVRTGLVRDPVGEYLRVESRHASPERRLLLLGDSFVDKRCGTFHDELLDALGDAPFEFANLAESGNGPSHDLVVLREQGGTLAPDVVVHFYYAGNDLINVIRYEPPQPLPGMLGRLRDSLRPWVHRSRLYHAVTERKGRPDFDFDAMLAGGEDPDLVARARAGEVNPWLLLMPREEREHYLATNLLIESDESRAGAGRLREVMREIAAETRALGARLLLVVFPDTVQVSRSHFEFLRRAGYHPDERMLVGDTPQRLVAEIAGELGVPILDLLPIFRAHLGEALYLPYDTHLNDRSNALAAEPVAAVPAPRDRLTALTWRRARRARCRRGRPSPSRRAGGPARGPRPPRAARDGDWAPRAARGPAPPGARRRRSARGRANAPARRA